MLKDLTDALHITLKVIDRGGRTIEARWIRKMKKYLKRALEKHGQPTGYHTITDRFRGDARYRAEMEKQGWNDENVEMADRVALTPSQPPEQARRTPEQRWAQTRAVPVGPTQRRVSVAQSSRRPWLEWQGWWHTGASSSSSQWCW